MPDENATREELSAALARGEPLPAGAAIRYAQIMVAEALAPYRDGNVCIDNVATNGRDVPPPTMSETRKTIDLPFSPDDVRSGRLIEDGPEFDRAWSNVLSDASLADIRRKLSIHDLRRLIRAVLR